MFLIWNPPRWVQSSFLLVICRKAKIFASLQQGEQPRELFFNFNREIRVFLLREEQCNFRPIANCEFSIHRARYFSKRNCSKRKKKRKIKFMTLDISRIIVLVSCSQRIPNLICPRRCIPPPPALVKWAKFITRAAKKRRNSLPLGSPVYLHVSTAVNMRHFEERSFAI